MRESRKDRDQRIVKALTLFNSAIIFVAILGVISLAAWYQDFLRIKLNNFFEREVASSDFLETVIKPMIEIGDSEAEADPLAEVKHFSLNISAISLRRIEVLAQRMVKQGGMTDKDKIWVPATFTYGTNNYKVKVRLRGDVSNHWRETKKSWRIKFKDNVVFEGMREFNLVIAKERYFEVEPTAYHFAKKLGLFTRKAGLGTLKINNVDMGDYVWFEQMSKETLERERLPEGNVISGSNSWIDFRPNYSSDLFRYYDYPSAYKSMLKDRANAGVMFGQWQGLTQLVLNGSDSEIETRFPYYIDMDKLATWNAIALMFGADHSLHQTNTNWYFNGATGLFEPIIYDLNLLPIGEYKDGVLNYWKPRTVDYSPNFLLNRAFAINAFQQKRNAVLLSLLNNRFTELKEMAARYFHAWRPYILRGAGARSANTVDANFRKRQEALDMNRTILLDLLTRTRLFVNGELVRKAGVLDLTMNLMPDSLAEIGIKEIVIKSEGVLPRLGPRASLSLSRTGLPTREVVPSGVQATENEIRISFKGLNIWQKRDKKLEPRLTNWTATLHLPIEAQGEPTETFPLAGLEVSAVNNLTGQPIEPHMLRVSPLRHTSTAENWGGLFDDAGEAVRQTGLPFAIEAGNLILDAGDYSLRKTFIVPSGYGLVLKAGVVLKMAPGASLASYGPAQILGSADNPVRMEPADEKRPWGVFGVVRPGGLSVFRHLNIKGGGKASINGVTFTGQLSVHYGDVDIADSLFADSASEDSLNVKHGKIKILRTKFDGNRSDGFDGDWVRGTITDSEFSDNGDDGIDVSGSTVLVRNTRLSGMGDNAISVGENSRVQVWNGLFSGSAIGIASKDRSVTTVAASAFVGNGTALSVYRKKQLFGGASATVLGSLFVNNGKDLEIDAESRVRMEGTGLASLPDLPGLEMVDTRVGAIDEAYALDDSQRPHFKGAAGQGELFGKGPDVTPEAFLGVEFPNLSEAPVGLWSPEDLP